MAIVTPSRKLIYEEETRYQAAVSESTFQKMAASHNFISERQHVTKRFSINGSYDTVVVPYPAIDGGTQAFGNMEIINVSMGVDIAGASGYTELDVLIGPATGGPFVSIFSVKPRINAAAGNYRVIRTGDVGANITAPVLATSLISDGYQIRCDLTATQTGGSLRNCWLEIHWRPSN